MFLLFLTPLLLQAADEPTTWSQPVNGLRARLFIAPSHDPDFSYNFQVYLQFENVGVVGNLGAIREEKTFQYSEMHLALIVTNNTGQKLPLVTPNIVDEMILSGYTMCLPFGGNLVFPIGHGWDLVPSHPISLDGPLTPVMLKGRYLKRIYSSGWVIPSDGSGTYYLSGTFSFNKKDAEPHFPPGIHPVRHSDVRLNWEGTLVLPPIKVPSQ